jgi:hypothetical protein
MSPTVLSNTRQTKWAGHFNRNWCRMRKYRLSRDGVNIDGLWFHDWIYWTFRYSAWLHFTVRCYTHTSVHSHVFTAVAWYRLPTADIRLSLGSRTVPDLSYQLLKQHLTTTATQQFSNSPIQQPTQMPAIKIKVTLWLAVYRQSVHLGAEPLEYHDQRFCFFNWILAIIVLMWHREDRFVSYEYAWPLVKCTYRTYGMLSQILLFELFTSQDLQSKSCLSYVSHAPTEA